MIRRQLSSACVTRGRVTVVTVATRQGMKAVRVVAYLVPMMAQMWRVLKEYVIMMVRGPLVD